MPVIVLWGVAALMSGYGIKLMGDAVEDASKGVSDLMIAGAVVGAVYLIAKNRGAL